MREIEVKSTVDDLARRRAAVERAGATRVFEGRLEDRRYDTPERALLRRDHVLRLRIYRDGEGARAELNWKGPTSVEGGFKVREELGAATAEPAALAAILGRLGFVVTRAIDRAITQYHLHGATVRFECYPRMDVLVEVEGSETAIERAIQALGLPRSGFTSDRLPDFVARFEQRTGLTAALCDDELAGTIRYDAREA